MFPSLRLYGLTLLPLLLLSTFTISQDTQSSATPSAQTQKEQGKKGDVDVKTTGTPSKPDQKKQAEKKAQEKGKSPEEEKKPTPFPLIKGRRPNEPEEEEGDAEEVQSLPITSLAKAREQFPKIVLSCDLRQYLLQV